MVTVLYVLGLDLTGSCPRFYDETVSPMPSESLVKTCLKILPFFTFYEKKNVSDLNIFNYQMILQFITILFHILQPRNLEGEIYYDKIVYTR